MLVTDILTAGTAPLPASGCLPVARTLTGTFSTTSKKIIGVGTLFEKELVQGDYLFDTTQNSLRRVSSVFNNTEAYLEEDFPIDSVAGELVKISRPLYVSLAVIPTGACTINGDSLSSGTILNFNSDGTIAPITYTGSVRFSVGYNV